MRRVSLLAVVCCLALASLAWVLRRPTDGNGLPRASSDHFVVSQRTPLLDPGSVGDVLAAAERVRSRVAERTGLVAREPIVILLYEPTSFHEETSAPEWARGLFDGTVRLAYPTGSGARGLEPLLTHEYVHALLHERSGGRVPRWIDEGLASVISERLFWPEVLERLIAMRGEPLGSDDLRDGFELFEPLDLALAYEQTYWMVRELVEMHGYEPFAALLADLDAGDPFRQGFVRRFGESLERFLERWARQRRPDLAARAGGAAPPPRT